ncbi:hypothetical protein CLV99_2761 [Sphingobacterium yanglingense]|uniref:Uncharacterized protein n=1 Tax=Sphingobacterium yanglingense TaxID=1437280 RepID=A0A4R6WIF3_9SPHI|nr:hypothetical protein CLV99_2761 [Sphingobacterium yanglingense]
MKYVHIILAFLSILASVFLTCLGLFLFTKNLGILTPSIFIITAILIALYVFKTKLLFVKRYENVLTYPIVFGSLFISIITYNIFKYERMDDPDNQMILIAIVSSILIPILYLIFNKRISN